MIARLCRNVEHGKKSILQLVSEFHKSLISCAYGQNFPWKISTRSVLEVFRCSRRSRFARVRSMFASSKPLWQTFPRKEPEILYHRNTLILAMFGATSVAMQARQLFLASTSRRCTHSYAPISFHHHLQCVNRVSQDVRDLSLDGRVGDSSPTPELQSALEGFEKVVGIRAQDVNLLFQYAPSQKDRKLWEERLMSWKGVNGGKDVFLRGLTSLSATLLVLTLSSTTMMRAQFSSQKTTR